MDVPMHLQPIVEAITRELERQLDENQHPHDIGYLDTGGDPDAVRIDGSLDLVALARAVMFCPTGDNHHNAALCPHCTPSPS